MDEDDVVRSVPSGSIDSVRESLRVLADTPPASKRRPTGTELVDSLYDSLAALKAAGHDDATIAKAISQGGVVMATDSFRTYFRKATRKREALRLANPRRFPRDDY